MMCSFIGSFLFACLIVSRINGVITLRLGGNINDLMTSGTTNFILDVNAPMDTIKRFCPAATCSTNETNGHASRLMNRCCIPFDCTGTCRATGTCCIGAGTETGQFSKSKENDILMNDCVKTSTGNSKADLFVNDMDMYSLVQFCPSKKRQFKNDEIRTKCLKPNNDHLDEVIPVYSHTTRRNYRNIYCAKCNNDFVNANQWETHLICDSLSSSSIIIPYSASEGKLLLKMIRSNYARQCMLKWKLTSGAAEPCIDNSSLISSCPVGYHDYENKCRKLFAPVRGNKGVYRNVFCLACNEDPESCFSGRNDNRNEEKFSVVLKSEVFTTGRQHVSGDKAEKCQNGKVYDNLLRECIMKACPMTYVRVGNSCQPAISEVSGTRFDYRLQILYQAAEFKLPSDDEILSVVRHLVLHNNETGAELCSEEVLGLATEDNKFVISVMFIKHVRKPTSLYDDYKLFADKIADFNKRTTLGEVHFSVEIPDKVEYELVFSVGYIQHVKHKYKLPFGCKPALAMTRIQFCDIVILKESPCSGGSVSLENGVTLYPGEYVLLINGDTPETVGVCYDNYVYKIMNAEGLAISGFAGCLSASEIYYLLLLAISLSTGYL